MSFEVWRDSLDRKDVRFIQDARHNPAFAFELVVEGEGLGATVTGHTVRRVL